MKDIKTRKQKNRVICPRCSKPGVQRYFTFHGVAVGDFDATEPDPSSVDWHLEDEPYYCPHCRGEIWGWEPEAPVHRRKLRRQTNIEV